MRILFGVRTFLLRLNMGKTCVICGKPSGMYPLCREHLQMKADGKVIKCEDCGTWHIIGKPCVCTSSEQKSISDKTVLSELTCLLCGELSNGKHFCRTCYVKYKDRSVDIRITNCKTVEKLDEYGNLQYRCADGRKVRSRAEAMISDWLYNNKIRSVYEEPVYYSENGETKSILPDFYLPDYGCYIEYNELTSEQYLKSKDYTQKIYAENNLKVIVMNEKDLHDISACLKPKLGLH